MKRCFIQAVGVAAVVWLAVPQARAVVFVHEGFQGVTNNASIDGYDGTATSTGLSGAWSQNVGTAQRTKLSTTATWQGIELGYAPDGNDVSNTTFWEQNNAWNVGIADVALTSPIDMTTDGSFYMSFFTKTSNNDSLLMAGFNDGVNELMWGNAFSGNDAADPKGVTASFGAIGNEPKTNANHTYLAHGGSAGETLFWAAKITKSDSGGADNLDVDIMGYNLTSSNMVDMAEPTSWLRSVSMSGVSTVFTDLQLKISGGGGNWPAMDEIRIGETWEDIRGVFAPTILTLQVDTDTGQVSIRNDSDNDFQIDYYDIVSSDAETDGGSLQVANWTSLEDQDLPGFPSGSGAGDGWEEAGFVTDRVVGETFLGSTSVAGDFNGDDSVDAADYALWRNTLGDEVAAGTGADANGDGEINAADYDIWRGNFGADPGDGTSSSLFASGMTPIDLGLLFDTTDSQDLEFVYRLSDGTFVEGLVEYVSSGSSAAGVVPEPSALWVLACGLTFATIRRQGSGGRASN